MSTISRTAPTSPPPLRPDAGRPDTERRAHLVELAVVVLLLSPYVFSFVSAATAGQVGFGFTAASTMLHDAGLVALAAFLVWRGGGMLSDLGWRWHRPLREVLIGAVAFPVGFVLVRVLDSTLQQLGVPGPAAPVTFLRPPSTPAALATATVLTLVVAFSEETVFRGYLLLRLTAHFLQDFTVLVALTLLHH